MRKSLSELILQHLDKGHLVTVAEARTHLWTVEDKLLSLEQVRYALDKLVTERRIIVTNETPRRYYRGLLRYAMGKNGDEWVVRRLSPGTEESVILSQGMTEAEAKCCVAALIDLDRRST